MERLGKRRDVAPDVRGVLGLSVDAFVLADDRRVGTCRSMNRVRSGWPANATQPCWPTSPGSFILGRRVPFGDDLACHHLRFCQPGCREGRGLRQCVEALTVSGD
jgi:hypothetical protein